MSLSNSFTDLNDLGRPSNNIHGLNIGSSHVKMPTTVTLPEPFASIPRSSLTFGPSPIQSLPKISAALGGKVNVYAKREDVNSGLAYGGNKVRKLEYLVPEAVAKGCDTL